MAEPTAQQLARQRLAATDLAKFAPPPTKRKKAELEQPKYTTPAVKTSAEERKAKQNGWEVDDDEVYKTAEIEAWHPLPMPPEEEQ